MRIDITTPIMSKPPEKKESVQNKKLFIQQPEMESDLTRQQKSAQAPIIDFIEERKKRRAKLKNKLVENYFKFIETKKGSHIDVKA